MIDFKFKNINELDKYIINSIMHEKTIPEIAESIGYSTSGIKRRLTYLYRLYGVRSKIGLIREFLKQ